MQKFYLCSLCRRYKSFKLEELKNHILTTHSKDFKLAFIVMLKRIRAEDLNLIIADDKKYFDVTAIYDNWVNGLLNKAEVE